MGTNRPRFSVTVSDELYQKINDFQHENKLSTQTKAIERILQLGIGVLSNTQPQYETKKITPSAPEDEGIRMYKRLDEIDKAEIRGEMKHMLKAHKYGSVVIPIAARGGGVSEVVLSPEQAKELDRVIAEEYPELLEDD